MAYLRKRVGNMIPSASDEQWLNWFAFSNQAQSPVVDKIHNLVYVKVSFKCEW